MPETIPSADDVRAMLTENLGKIRAASAEYFQLLEKSSSQLPIADQARQFTEHLQRNVTASFDLCDKLIKANDAQDAMRIQAEFFQAQMSAMTEQARSIGESAMKAMTGAFTPKR